VQFRLGNYEVSAPVLGLIALGAAWLVYAAFFAPEGLFTDDEIIYVAMIDRFATTGSFVIENGYDIVPAESLRLVTLQAGPHGLVPQYPAGFAIVAAPFYLAGGLQGIIFLNALATVLTLWLTYLIALELFKERELAESVALIFGLATFAVDYAFGIWPHATANLFVAAAIFAAVRAFKRPDSDWRWSAAAGLVIGVGVSMRSEVVIAAPILFVWLFVNARHPARTTGALLAALGLGLAVAAWLNQIKFGVFHPMYYGASRGAGDTTSLANYARYVPYALLALVLAMSLRLRTVQGVVAHRRYGWLLLGGVITATLVIPPLRELAWQMLHGLYALVVDLRQLKYIDTHPRIQWIDGEFYLYYGMLKKSLVESLPWLGLATFGVAGMFKSERRAAHALCLLFPLVWFLPTAASEWIGGRANNMRYLSAALPLLSVLAAVGWRTVAGWHRGRGVNVTSALWGLSVPAAAGLLYLASSNSRHLGFFQAFFVTGSAQWLALAVLVLSIAWLAWRTRRRWLQGPLLIAVQVSLLMALVAGYAFDASVTRTVRAQVQQEAASYAYIEPNAHMVAPGLFASYFQLLRPEATLAFPTPESMADDIRFIERALQQGRPVYLATVELTRSVRKELLNSGRGFGPGGFSIEPSISAVDGQHHGLYQLKRRPPK
jgi:4-amino-4-deoxy-L-arabinose transferase-like glycosyltransferase